MYPNTLFEINGRGIVTLYGIMIALGILAAFLVLWKLARVGKVESRFVDFTSLSLVFSIAVGFLFAAVFQWVYDKVEAGKAGLPAPKFSFEGMTFMGGLIGGTVVFLLVYVLTIYVIGKKTKKPAFKFQGRLIDVLSILPISLTLAHGFGRIGCFFAGCCYGKPTDLFFGIKFPETAGPVIPTQLFEAIFLFLLCFVMFMLYIKKRFQQNMGLYMIAYGVFRFVIEFFRDDARGEFVPGLSPSQFWSIIMIILGIILIVLMVPIAKKRALYLEENPVVEPERKSKKKAKDKTEPVFYPTTPSTSADSVEDGFKLDEKIIGEAIIGKHLPKEYEIKKDISQKQVVEPSVGNVITTPKTTDEEIPSYDIEKAPVKVGQVLPEEGFTLTSSPKLPLSEETSSIPSQPEPVKVTATKETESLKGTTSKDAEPAKVTTIKDVSADEKDIAKDVSADEKDIVKDVSAEKKDVVKDESAEKEDSVKEISKAQKDKISKDKEDLIPSVAEGTTTPKIIKAPAKKGSRAPAIPINSATTKKPSAKKASTADSKPTTKKPTTAKANNVDSEPTTKKATTAKANNVDSKPSAKKPTKEKVSTENTQSKDIGAKAPVKKTTSRPVAKEAADKARNTEASVKKSTTKETPAKESSSAPAPKKPTTKSTQEKAKTPAKSTPAKKATPKKKNKWVPQ